MLLRDASVTEDARTMSRYHLAQLKTQLRQNVRRSANVETRAHLQETIARIDEALGANMQRMTF